MAITADKIVLNSIPEAQPDAITDTLGKQIKADIQTPSFGVRGYVSEDDYQSVDIADFEDDTYSSALKTMTAPQSSSTIDAGQVSLEGADLDTFKTLVRENGGTLKKRIKEFGYKKLFTDLDKNSDGILSKDELSNLKAGATTLSDISTDDIRTYKRNFKQRQKSAKKSSKLFFKAMQTMKQLVSENSSGSDEVSRLISRLNSFDSKTKDTSEDPAPIHSDAQAASSSSETDTSGFTTAFKNSSFAGGALKTMGSFIQKCSKKYGVDPYLVSAIMACETGWGKSKAIKTKNNPGGFMDTSTGCKTIKHFATLEDGIEAVIKNIANNYIKKGLTSIKTIGAKYCPVGAANDVNGTNGSWVSTVTSIYKKLSGKNINASTKL